MTLKFIWIVVGICLSSGTLAADEVSTTTAAASNGGGTITEKIMNAKNNARLDRTDLLQYHDESTSVCHGTTLEHWQLRRAEVIRGMEQVMGPLPGQDKRCPLDVEIEKETDCGLYVRRLVTFTSEPGSRTPAYLLIPKAGLQKIPPIKLPAILALHSTQLELGHKVVIGIGGSHNRDYGHALAERGYVVIAPSYPLMADYEPDLQSLGYVSGSMKAVWDNIRCLDLLDAMPNVDRENYGAVGHSLGGHNAIFTAVFDARIKVVVSSCGFDSFLDYMGGNLKGWMHERYMPRLGDYRPASIPFDFYELIATLAPRPVFVSAPLHDDNFDWQSVDRIADAARPIYNLYGKPAHVQVVHPDCAHDFPDIVRESAFAFMDRKLRSNDLSLETK